jgi:hypothetical protein
MDEATPVAMEVWRSICASVVRAKPDDKDQAAAAVIATALADMQRRVEDLEAENAKLRGMFAPQWFYADGYASEDCLDSPDEVLENLELKPGKHVVSVDCAGPMPSIWCAVCVLTDEEMDTLETDDRVSFTEHSSEEAARQALSDKTQEKNDG